MWKIEQDEYYFRILDENGNIAGYFDPEYGVPESEGNEKIERMLKEGALVGSGYLVFPMVKFNIFDTDYNETAQKLRGQIEGVMERIDLWVAVANSGRMGYDHMVNISHTDHDMLSITFRVLFRGGVRLRGSDVLARIRSRLDALRAKGLL